MTNYGITDPVLGNMNIFAGGATGGKGSGASAAEKFAAALKANLSSQANEAPEGMVLAPDGATLLEEHDWETDTTDYVEVLRNAASGQAFMEYAQKRIYQAQAQGIDISGNGSEPSTPELYDEWYALHGADPGHGFHVYDKEGFGYYGMDSEGHWGYYLDQGLTQKNPNGGWDLYKASDGGRALFDTQKGYLWPSNVRDESRAGQTVTITAGKRAFEVTYNDNGYIKTVKNLTDAQGIDGRELDLPAAMAVDDRGVNGHALLQQTNGVAYAGPGSTISPRDAKGADFRDWEAVMASGGYTPPAAAAAQESSVAETAPATVEEAVPADTEEAAPAAAEQTAPETAEENISEAAGGTVPEAAEEAASQNVPQTEQDIPTVQSGTVQPAENAPVQQSAESEGGDAELLRQLSVEQLRTQINISRQADARAFLDALDKEREDEGDRRA